MFCFRNVATAFRVVAGRKSVEVGLAVSLTDRNHSLDHLFIAKEVKMKEKGSKPDNPETEQLLDENIDD